MTGPSRDNPRSDRTVEPAAGQGSQRLAILLAMAMFVLVVDTSLMNVSISAVVHDLHTTVSGVQSAIALEALVSAAFILIGSKVGDLIGRKRAYVLGLLGYAVGALAMALGPEPDRDHRLLGDRRRAGRVAAAAGHAIAHPWQLRGRRQKQAYALVGAAAAIAAAVGPLLGGFITTYLSWRIAFLLEDSSSPWCSRTSDWSATSPYTGTARRRRRRGRCCLSLAWVASCWASSSGRKAVSRVAALHGDRRRCDGSARPTGCASQASRASRR